MQFLGKKDNGIMVWLEHKKNTKQKLGTGLKSKNVRRR